MIGDPLHKIKSPADWLIGVIRRMGLEYVCKRYYGIYRAIVIDVEDPEGRGRIRAICPAIGQTKEDDVGEDHWALPCMPGLSVGAKGGQAHGVFMPPNLGDQVWIQFESGLPEHPIYVGGWLPENQFKGTDLIHEKALYKGIRTSSGHYIRMSDAEGDLSISIVKGDGKGEASGTYLTMTDSDEVLLATANGNLLNMSKTQTTLFAPDGCNAVLGEGQAKLMDDGGNSFGLDGGKFEIQCDEVVISASKKISLKSNVDLGPGPVYEPAMTGLKASILLNTHVHTTTMPGAPTSPQVTPPITPGNGLSLAVRVS